MGLIAGKCPECGAALKISDRATGELICPYCGTPYLVEQAITTNITNVTNNVTNNMNINNATINVEKKEEFVIVGGVLKEYKGENQDVVIPNSVSEIGERAFFSTGIRSVVISANVEKIGKEAFGGCRKLERVSFEKGSKLLTIISGAFDGCFFINKIEIPDCDLFARISVTSDDWLSGSAGFPITAGIYVDGCLVKDVKLSYGLLSIGRCFEGNKYIERVYIPSSVELIEYHAFSFCENLKEVIFDSKDVIFNKGNSLKHIGDSAFFACKSLKKINLNVCEHLEKIGSSSFAKCTGLDTITIPESVKEIGYGAFENCINLNDVEFDNDNPKTINIGMVAFNNVPAKNVKSLNKTQKKGCYVATCVYGSYDCPEVWVLRRFRDQKLGATWYGRLFIKTYYAISPTLVKWFGHTNWFKNMWRGKLNRMVEKYKSQGFEDTPYDDINW